MNQLTYYLSRANNQSPYDEFKKLISAINTIDGIGIQEGEKKQVAIFYHNNSFRPTLKLEEVNPNKLPKNSDLIQPLIVLKCETVDNITVPVIKNAAIGLGYRIFNTILNCFLPEDPNLDDVSSGIIDPKINEIIKKSALLPLFRFLNTLVFYAQSKDKSIHLINSYLLEYFLTVGTAYEATPEFSYRVSPNLELFIPMYDQGLVPLNFYEYYRKPIKIINYSSFDIENVRRKIFIKPFIFELKDRTQKFFSLAAEGSSLLYCDKIRKEETLNDAIIRVLSKDLDIADDYIGARVSRRIEFDKDKENKLTPRLLVFIYVDKIRNRKKVEKEAQRGWRSIAP